MTPERRADTLPGAAGWARGSQLLIGTRPAFTPNPKNASRNTPHRRPSGRVATACRIAANSPLRAAAAKRKKASAPASVPASPTANIIQPARMLESRSSSKTTRR